MSNKSLNETNRSTVPLEAKGRIAAQLQKGQMFPESLVWNIHGQALRLPYERTPWTHVQFRRFAGCPICNLHLQSFVKRNDEVVGAGIKEEKLAAATTYIRDCLKFGFIQVEIARKFTFPNVVEAYRYLESSEAFGKVVIIFPDKPWLSS